MFLRDSKNPIGLDISDLSLKIVQVAGNPARPRIQAIGKIAVPKGAIEDGEIKDEGKVIGLIKELIEHPRYGRTTSKEIVACLPEKKTFVKLIELESDKPCDDESVLTEIQKHIPYSPEEIDYDWQLIEKIGGINKILVGAAPKEIAEKYGLLIENAGLILEALEIEPIAICRSLLREENPLRPPEMKFNYLIADIGARRTGIVCYSRDTILFTASVKLSGERTTKKIAETLKLTDAQAEEAKIICGLDPDKARGAIRKIISGAVDELAEKIKEALDFYHENYADRGPIAKILISGGGSNVKDLAKTISREILIETKIGNPFINLKSDQEKLRELIYKDEKIKKNKKIAAGAEKKDLSSYATAVGLALRKTFLK